MKFYYYKITNIKNGRFYIGITTDFNKRKTQHFKQLRGNYHDNYKMQKDFNKFGEDSFRMDIIDELEGTEEEGYAYEYILIQKTNATSSYNISEGGKINPVYCPQVIEKLKKTHQSKYPNILQYSFDGHNFKLEHIWFGIRDASRSGEYDFRAIQNSTKTTQAHHEYFWVKEGEQEQWLEKFLKRHTCCVAKINEQTEEIEDTALTIKDFANKYNTTYDRIYLSIRQNQRCERKYKFIRITAETFAEINNLSL
jgi:group I intron endonuclease